MTTNPKDLIGSKKAPLQLVPPSLALAAAAALDNGATKYGPYNWREQPVQASIYYAAAQRHLAAWFDGEDTAEDSGVAHLAHAVACLAIVIDCDSIGTLIDDRPPHGAASAILASMDRSQSVVAQAIAASDAAIADSARRELATDLAPRFIAARFEITDVRSDCCGALDISTEFACTDCPLQYINHGALDL